MKKTLNEIQVKISKVSNSLREDAAFSGQHDDDGASNLEKSLSMFINGIKAATDNKFLSGDTEYEVPVEWRKYFLEDEKEYQEYLRLKSKFESK